MTDTGARLHVLEALPIGRLWKHESNTPSLAHPWLLSAAPANGTHYSTVTKGSVQTCHLPRPPLYTSADLRPAQGSSHGIQRGERKARQRLPTQ